MGDLLGSLIWGAKSGQYCVIGDGSLHLFRQTGQCSSLLMSISEKLIMSKVFMKLIMVRQTENEKKGEGECFTGLRMHQHH
jgi:hypothetical protein